MVQKRIFLTLSIIFAFILFLVYFGCQKNPTHPKMGLISGRVRLENQTNHQGVMVEVYPIVSIPQELVNISQQFPNIGIPLSQGTEFDHRFQSPLAVSQTDTGGNFALETEVGQYNLVVRKAGFGWKYFYELSVSPDQNYNVGAIQLYSEQIISVDITTPTTWVRNHHYIINGNRLITAPLTVESGVVIRMSDQSKLDVRKPLSIQGIPDSLCYIIGDFSDGVSKWISVLASDSSTQIQNCVIRQGYECLVLSGNPGHLKNIRITKCDTGIRATAQGKPLIENLTISDATTYGVYSSFSKTILKKSIFFQNAKGIYFNNPSPDSQLVEDSYFLSNNTGIDILETNALLNYNDFRDNDVGIATSLCALHLNGNVFYDQRSSCLSLNSSSSGSAHGNNFLNSPPSSSGSYSIAMIATIYSDFDAASNWWGTQTQSVIKDKILDMNDNSSLIGAVNWLPALNALVTPAGIR